MKNNKQIYKHGNFASENTSELQDIYDFDYKSWSILLVCTIQVYLQSTGAHIYILSRT